MIQKFEYRTREIFQVFFVLYTAYCLKVSTYGGENAIRKILFSGYDYTNFVIWCATAQFYLL